jgi:hypothetical protein
MMNARNDPIWEFTGPLTASHEVYDDYFTQEGQDSWYSLLCAPKSEMEGW